MASPKSMKTTVSKKCEILRLNYDANASRTLCVVIAYRKPREDGSSERGVLDWTIRSPRSQEWCQALD